MKRTYIKELKESIGEEVKINGFVSVRRDHGKLIFLDVRDMTGTVQVVVLPNHIEAKETAEKLRSEWVVEITAKVNKRPDNMVKKDELNGELELEALEIKILNSAETPAFDVLSDGREIGEEGRLTYRYLDLRRPRMQKNLRNRHKVIKLVRDFLDKNGFVEIETPMFTKSTPEGSRDFVVPSRIYQGKFYALPQSPQQYKQLLMTAGMEKYFQIARCMRDEDTRGDRQPEFTQMDLEMSFVKKEDVMDLNEALLIKIVQEIYPEKEIQQIPFPRITYKEAMEKYGSDKPDIRKDKDNPNLLAFVWVTDFPFFEKDEKAEKNPDGSDKITFTHNPFSRPIDEHMDWLLNSENVLDIMTTQYDIALNGSEIGGGSIRNHEPEALRKVFDILGHKKEDVESNFGHMLKAFSFGTPPHGGIAWGLDRLMMILENEENIREVIAFAKTGEGRDLMMDSPSEIEVKQLDELGLEIKKKK